MSQTFRAVVSRKTALTSRVLLLEIRPDPPIALASYEPGAHIDLILPNGMTRQYSLLPPSKNGDRWEVAVLRDPEGKGGSEFVHTSLKEGDLLDVRGPRNHFPLLAACRYKFIAGGIGITPILGMINAAQSKGVDWSLVYLGKSVDEMAFASDLLIRYGKHVSVHESTKSGRLSASTLLEDVSTDTSVYFCGPNKLLSELQDNSDAIGPHTLRSERFSPLDVSDRAGDDAFIVQLARSNLTLEVAPDRTILETVEKAGVFVLSSCMEGTCGSCETRVLVGQVDHRDSVLTDSERNDGRTLMVCVSRAISPALILDL